MTKKETGEVARQATRYGYSHHNATEGSVRCPRCQEPVTAYKMAWDRSFTLAMWTRAFYDHLQDCERSSL